MAAVDVIALALRDGAKHSRVPSERILQLMGHRQRWKYPLLVRGGEPDVQVWNIGRIGEEGLRYSDGAMWDEAHGGGDEARAVAAAVSDVGEVAEEQGGRSGAW